MLLYMSIGKGEVGAAKSGTIGCRGKLIIIETKDVYLRHRWLISLQWRLRTALISRRDNWSKGTLRQI